MIHFVYHIVLNNMCSWTYICKCLRMESNLVKHEPLENQSQLLPTERGLLKKNHEQSQKRNRAETLNHK